MKDMLVNQEQQLAQMVKSGKSESIQAGLKTVIEELRSDIKNLEAKSRESQIVYDYLEQEMKTQLLQRIKQVNNEVKTGPPSDQQAAIMATDKKVSDLEKKLEDFEAQNFKLHSKSLQQQQQLQELRTETQNQLTSIQVQSDEQKRENDELKQQIDGLKQLLTQVVEQNQADKQR